MKKSCQLRLLGLFVNGRMVSLSKYEIAQRLV